MADDIPAPSGRVLRTSYHIFAAALQSSHIDNEVRRSLELVRTCDRDLQHLIGLRDEHLDALERRPVELDRVNMIIREAHRGLAEVCRIVEKCRPEANKGKISFKSRSRWVMLDSAEFRNQVPIVSGHHRAVLNEISFLRQLSVHDARVSTPAPDWIPCREQDRARVERKKTVAIDNIALLGNLMRGKPVMPQPPNIPPKQPSFTELPAIPRSPSELPATSSWHTPARRDYIPELDGMSAQRQSAGPSAGPSAIPPKDSGWVCGLAELDSTSSRNPSISELPADHDWIRGWPSQPTQRTTPTQEPVELSAPPFSSSSASQPQDQHVILPALGEGPSAPRDRPIILPWPPDPSGGLEWTGFMQQQRQQHMQQQEQ